MPKWRNIAKSGHTVLQTWSYFSPVRVGPGARDSLDVKLVAGLLFAVQRPLHSQLGGSGILIKDDNLQDQNRVLRFEIFANLALMGHHCCQTFSLRTHPAFDQVILYGHLVHDWSVGNRWLPWQWTRGQCSLHPSLNSGNWPKSWLVLLLIKWLTGTNS